MESGSVPSAPLMTNPTDPDVRERKAPGNERENKHKHALSNSVSGIFILSPFIHLYLSHLVYLSTYLSLSPVAMFFSL